MAFGFQAPTHIGKREVGILRLGDGNRLDAIALMTVSSGIEGITQAHVGIQRIIARTDFLLRHGIIQGRRDLGLIREELTEFELGGNGILFLGIGTPLHHALFQSTKAIADIAP